MDEPLNCSNEISFAREEDRTLAQRCILDRVALAAFRGFCNRGLQVDHVCENKACVNPDHLRQCTNKVNSSFLGLNYKTHCLKGGHRLSEVGVYESPAGNLSCKACRKESQSRWYSGVKRARSSSRTLTES
jgi:hypothetical protein